MAIQRFFGYNRILATGAPVPNGTVTVFDAGTLTLSTIFADSLLTPKANPFQADGDGFFFFYASNGRYDVSFTNGASIPLPYTWGDIQLGFIATLNGLTADP